jgi:hypothetical protein
MLTNDVTSDKRQELPSKAWVQVAERREMPQAAHLLRLSAGIARGWSVLRLQFADSPGTPKPLCQRMDNRGIDIIDAVPQVLKCGSRVGRICHHILSFACSLQFEKPPHLTLGLRHRSILKTIIFCSVISRIIQGIPPMR